MLRYEKGEQQGVMAKKLVYFCLRVLLWTAVWAAAMKTVGIIIDRAVEMSDILTFVGAAFGGELLMLLLKRVFTKKGDTYDG